MTSALRLLGNFSESVMLGNPETGEEEDKEKRGSADRRVEEEEDEG